MSTKENVFKDLDGVLGHSASPLEIVSFAEFAGTGTKAREAVRAKLAGKPKSDYEQALAEIGNLFADSLKDKSPEEIQRLATKWATQSTATKKPEATSEPEVSQETLDLIERFWGIKLQKGMPMQDEEK